MNEPVSQRIAATFDRRLALRVIVLGAAVLATVLVPYFLTRNWAREAVEAEAWVTHTAEVSDTATQLMFNVRNLEAGAYGAIAGISATSLYERYAAARPLIDPLIEKLTRLSRDNPEQQVRIGQIKLVLDTRLPYLDRTVKLRDDPAEMLQARRELDRMLTEGSVGNIAQAVTNTENALLERRSIEAEKRRGDVERLQAISTFAQLVLLGVIAWFSERELRGRRRAETLSSSADTRNRVIFHAVREPIALLDRDLNILTHNTAFAELYGEVDESAGARTALAQAGNGAWADVTLQQRLLDVVTRDREIWDFEHRQRTVDGVSRQVLVNAKRIALPNDPANSAVLLTVSDVTPQKMAENQALQLNRQLAGKMEQVSEINRELEAFSYSVSHDLRAPLRHVSGFADKLRNHLDPRQLEDEKTRHYLDVIGSSASRMAVLIDDLLLYSRLGRHAMRIQQVDVERMVREVREMLTGGREDGHIQWHIDPLPSVAGDETMLRQVWQNLLGNAIKYSSRRELSSIEVRYGVANGMHEFSVRDNGVGFDMEYSGKLFGVFQRLHKASEFPGSGIGLANVRRIVTRHGGRVWADAEPGKGAIFHFTLPLRQDAPNTEPQKSAETTR